MRQVRDAMQQLLAAERALPGVLPSPLLITGESGSGKKTVARALHEDGPRRMHAWRVLRCATLSADQFEAACRCAGEAVQEPPRDAPRAPESAGSPGEEAGLPPLPHGATLVLDEVGELSSEAQDRLVERLAAWSQPGAGAVRVIATTRHALDERVQAGRFRADLCFRLGVFRIVLPPLRLRLEDVEGLAERFVAELAPRHGRGRPALARSAVRRLLAHRWSGNVRELRHAVEGALLMSSAPMLTGDDFALISLPDGHRATDWPPTPSASRPLGISVFEPVRGPWPLHRPGVAWQGGPRRAGRDPELAELAAMLAAVAPARRVPSETERAALVAALEHCHWNVCRTAQSLNLTRDALRYRIQKYGLRRQTQYRLGEGSGADRPADLDQRLQQALTAPGPVDLQRPLQAGAGVHHVDGDTVFGVAVDRLQVAVEIGP
jgi:DNA-binding NtrC family response regulator